MRCDLHIHSKYSDGTDDPSKIIDTALKVGLDCISFTEHDSLFGLNAWDDETSCQALSHGIGIIKGIELSARDLDTGLKTHILAYWPEAGSFSYSHIKPHIQKTRMMRNEIARNQVAHLNDLGLRVQYDDILKSTFDGQIFKAHIFRAIWATCKSEDEANIFFPLFKRGQRCYYYKDYPATQEIIQAVIKDGGVPFLAHPIYSKNINQIDRYVKMGLQGIECVHPTQDKEDMQIIHKIAKRYSLTQSGGSDYHGSNYRTGELGRYFISNDIASDFYQRLVQAHVKE